MHGAIGRFLQYFQDNFPSVSKWAAVTAIVLAAIVLGMSLSIPMIATAVKLSMVPVMIAGMAWGMANRAKARRRKLFAMLALWISLCGVFVSQVQYQRLVSAAHIVKPGVQNEQKQ